MSGGKYPVPLWRHTKEKEEEKWILIFFSSFIFLVDPVADRGATVYVTFPSTKFKESYNGNILKTEIV